MAAIHVNIADLGQFGVEAGGFRYTMPSGREAIVVHGGLPLDEQAALVAEFTYAGETPVYVNVPVQRQSGEGDQVRDRRSAVAARLRAAAAAASAVAAAGCSVPLAGG